MKELTSKDLATIFAYRDEGQTLESRLTSLNVLADLPPVFKQFIEYIEALPSLSISERSTHCEPSKSRNKNNLSRALFIGEALAFAGLINVGKNDDYFVLEQKVMTTVDNCTNLLVWDVSDKDDGSRYSGAKTSYIAMLDQHSATSISLDSKNPASMAPFAYLLYARCIETMGGELKERYEEYRKQLNVLNFEEAYKQFMLSVDDVYWSYLLDFLCFTPYDNPTLQLFLETNLNKPQYSPSEPVLHSNLSDMIFFKEGEEDSSQEDVEVEEDNKNHPSNWLGELALHSYELDPEALQLKEDNDRWLLEHNIKMDEMTRQVARAFLADDPAHEIFLVEFFGQSGSGKSTRARMVAGILGLPYRIFSAHADMEKSDITGEFIPRSDDKSFVVDEFIKTLPTYDEMIAIPDLCYLQITGNPWRKNEEITTDDAINAYNKAVEAYKTVHASNTKDDGFVYRKSQIVKGFTEPCITEIQELTNARPEAMVPLNAAFEEKRLELGTGEIIYKHPMSKFIITSNDGYLGTGDLTQSITSRISMRIPLDTPEQNELTEAIMSEFNLERHERDVVYEMAGIVKKIESYIEKERLTGMVDRRALKSWVYLTMINGDPYTQGKVAVITLADKNKEVRQFLTETFLDQSIFKERRFRNYKIIRKAN